MENKQDRALVLFSGGMDSTVLLASFVDALGAKNVIALSMWYGQRHYKELEAAELIAKHYGVQRRVLNLRKIFDFGALDMCSLMGESVLEIPQGEYKKELPTTYVPFRNGLFLATAASIALQCNCNIVAYGAHADDAAGDAYPDCSAQFAYAMNEAIREGTGGQVQLMAPFVEHPKAYIAQLGKALKVPFKMTWSCYAGGDKPCGKCATCIDRAKALATVGIVEEY